MRLTLVVLVALTLAPVAAASPATLEVRSHRDVALAGEATASIETGVARFLGQDAGGEWVFHIEEGTVTFLTHRHASVSIGVINSTSPLEDIEEEPFSVRNATLRIRLAGEPLGLSVIPAGGSVSVSGRVQGLGLPFPLPHDVDAEVRPGAGALGPADVEPTWRRGWWFVGSYHSSTPLAGFPEFEAPRVTAAGAVEIEALGGTVELTHAGETIVRRLGSWYEDGQSIDGPGVDGGRRTIRELEFTGAVASADLPPTESWGLAGPTMAWSLLGEVEWWHASGQATVDGERQSFDDAHLRLDGDLTGTFSQTGNPASPEFTYDLTGDVASLYLDGAAVGDSTFAGSPAVKATLLALVLAALAWFGREALARGAVLAYSRLTPGDVLAHPTRARMWSLVQARPGIHARELHRLVGGAWGPFRFHLRVLEEFRLLRLERRGRYILVLPVAKPADATVIPNETQRRVFDALPMDGTPVRIREIVERTGLSRQLVDYHLRALADQSLVSITTRVALGPRQVRRANQGPAQAAA